MTREHATREAVRIAAECGENCYIAESEIYARSYDEYGEGPYVVGSKAVFAVMMPHLTKWGGRVVGVVGPDGNPFFNDMALVLEDLAAALANKERA